MSQHVLIIGYLEQYIEELHAAVPDITLTVIEEPTLIPQQTLTGVKVIAGRYQQHNEAIDVALAAHQSTPFSVVMPFREYAVPIANDIAEKLSLAKVGLLASRCFRDKYILRQTLASHRLQHIKQPAFSKITHLAQLTAFFQQHGACVIKPSNKQASVGVFKIQHEHEIEQFYRASIQADEPGRLAVDRPLQWDYQAETLLTGEEYSTELFIQNGHIHFLNVTKKQVAEGPCPYEIGHFLPVSLFDPSLHQRFIPVCNELVDTLNVENAVLHAEWMVNDEGISLIECAARPPGGHITDLLSHSYGIGFFACYFACLASTQPIAIPAPTVISAVRQLTPKKGQVKRIFQTLPDYLQNSEVTLLQYQVNTAIGSKISITNNQMRSGYILAAAQAFNTLKAWLDEVANVVIETEAINETEEQEA